jgi:VCBS repeat-containing protein
LLAEYSWLQNADGSWSITDLRAGSPDGVDTLWSIELLQFADAVVAIGGDSPPPADVNDAPAFTSAAAAITLTEWADNSTAEAANTAHVASARITFTDADAGDVHAASFVARGTGYLGQFALTAMDQAADSFDWSFSVTDAAIDYLRAGESLVQKYDVTIDDGHGGRALQTVTITLAGTDDLTTTGKKGPPGKGKGAGNDGGSDSAADIHWFLDGQQDQAPAPQPEHGYGLDLPDVVPAGLAYSPMFGFLFEVGDGRL